MINSKNFMSKLTDAGIDCAGCNSSGEVWTADGTRIQAREDVAAVIADYLANPPAEVIVPTLEEQIDALKLIVSMLMEVQNV